jgi:acyl-homoserine-lactone acylase
MNKPVEALEQSFLRTKATDLASFMKVAELKANSSNNTLFADTRARPPICTRSSFRAATTASTTPSRSTAPTRHRLEGPARPVRGAAGEARKGGWLYEHQRLALFGRRSLQPEGPGFPRYMDRWARPRAGPRHPGALRRKDFTLPGLIAAAYDSYLTAFATWSPPWPRPTTPRRTQIPVKARLKDQVAALKAWNYRWGENSTETSLAVFWGEALWQKIKLGGARPSLSAVDRMVAASPQEKLQALAEASDRLQADFGAWKTPWGQINRYQRNNGDIVQKFDDAQPSIPVMFTSAQWGSLASFGARRYDGTKRYYGTSGNSFVAAIEFGPKIVARAVSAGGESGNPASKHFADQATRYATGNLREVYFYPEQLKGHTERTYKPGE